MHRDGPGLVQTFRYDHRAICTVQTRDFYQIETVVCPVQVSCVDGRESSGDYSVLRRVIQRSGLKYMDSNCAQFEERTSDPVDGDALYPTDASGDDVLPPRLITLGPGNPVQTHVRPVHSVIACQRGERNVMHSHHSLKQKPAHQNGFDCSTAHFTKCVLEI